MPLEEELEVSDIALIGAGWKSISLVDVHHMVTFTVWLCGCNLKCPFCHNYQIADNSSEKCFKLDIKALIDKLISSRTLIDYLHITGGEPLVQWKPLSAFLGILKGEVGVKISLNTNLTLYERLKRLIENGLVDHVATDLKIPPYMLFGLSKPTSDRLWERYLNGLSVISEYGVPLEMRVPVPKKVDIKAFKKYANQAFDRLKFNDYYVVVQPLLGQPITNPRNPAWCHTFCNPSKETLMDIASILRDFNVPNIVINDKLLVYSP